MHRITSSPESQSSYLVPNTEANHEPQTTGDQNQSAINQALFVLTNKLKISGELLNLHQAIGQTQSPNPVSKLIDACKTQNISILPSSESLTHYFGAISNEKMGYAREAIGTGPSDNTLNTTLRKLVRLIHSNQSNPNRSGNESNKLARVFIVMVKALHSQFNELDPDILIEIEKVVSKIKSLAGTQLHTDLATLIVKEDGLRLSQLGKQVRNDLTIATEAIIQNPLAFEQIPFTLKIRYPDFRDCYRFITNPVDLEDQAVQNGAQQIDFVQVARALVKGNPLGLQYLRDSFKHDYAVVEEAVRRNGAALKYASDSLQKNTKLALLAIQSKPESYFDLPHSVKSNAEFKAGIPTHLQEIIDRMATLEADPLAI